MTVASDEARATRARATASARLRSSTRGQAALRWPSTSRVTAYGGPSERGCAAWRATGARSWKSTRQAAREARLPRQPGEVSIHESCTRPFPVAAAQRPRAGARLPGTQSSSHPEVAPRARRPGGRDQRRPPAACPRTWSRRPAARRDTRVRRALTEKADQAEHELGARDELCSRRSATPRAEPCRRAGAGERARRARDRFTGREPSLELVDRHGWRRPFAARTPGRRGAGRAAGIRRRRHVAGAREAAEQVQRQAEAAVHRRAAAEADGERVRGRRRSRRWSSSPSPSLF